MKNLNQSRGQIIFYNLFIIGFLFLFTACNNNSSKDKTSKTKANTIEKFETIFWNVKAISPDGQSLDVKVFDNAGDAHDIKAIQNSKQDNLLDIKAVVEGEKLPVKILVSKNQFSPVVAINSKGGTYKLEAISAKGEKLQVIGVERVGNIVIMKALTKKGKFYGIKAISPDGKLNDIKGIKINPQEREMTSMGHDIYAHVKAMHPSANEDNFKLPKKNIRKDIYQSDFERIIWNIKAITKDGKNLDIKAFDPDGNMFDVKATQDSKQQSLMNIKAFADGAELPVKIMQSSEEYAPVKAIGPEGEIYDIKAIVDDNVKLDIVGVSRLGNIVDVKAITETGEFYAVKAFAPDGKLNAVKGIKIFEREVEMRLRGNLVYAHLKAITQ